MTADELIGILRQGEGISVEFKSDFPLNAQTIGKEMAALANTRGGILLLGVSDDGAPTGISEPEKVVERLAGIARSCGLNVAPEIDKFQMSKNIFVVYAKIRPAPPCIYDGKIYHRIGSISVECKSTEQLLAIIEGKVPTFDPGKPTRSLDKPPRGRGKTTETEFFKLLARRPAEAVAAKAILDWARKNFTRVNWAKSSFNPVFEYGGNSSHNPISVLGNKTPRVIIKFGRMKKRNNLSELTRTELLRRLNRIEGINLPQNGIDKYPHIPLSVLADENSLKPFLRCIAWTITQVTTGGIKATGK